MADVKKLIGVCLITGIESDHNRRLFVQNTIDFAHQNGIKALAEGWRPLKSSTP